MCWNVIAFSLLERKKNHKKLTVFFCSGEKFSTHHFHIFPHTILFLTFQMSYWEKNSIKFYLRGGRRKKKKEGEIVLSATPASFILSVLKNQKSEKVFCELRLSCTYHKGKRKGKNGKSERKICFGKLWCIKKFFYARLFNSKSISQYSLQEKKKRRENILELFKLTSKSIILFFSVYFRNVLL